MQLLGVGGVAFGQNKRLDLSKLPDQKKVILEKIDSAKLIFSQEPIEAIDFVEEAIGLAIAGNYRYELAEGYFTLGEFNFRMETFASAVMYSGKALEIYKGLQLWDKTIDTHLLKGDAHVKLSEFIKAKSHYEQAQILAEAGKKQDELLMIRFKLADLKLLENKPQEAEVLFLQLKEDASANKKIELLAEIDSKLGEIYARTGDIVQANFFFENSNSNAFQGNNNDLINVNNSKLLENNYTVLASSPANQDILNSLNTAEIIFQDANDTSAWITNTSQQADYYIKTGQLKEAENTLKKNFQLATEKGDVEAQYKSSTQLYDLYMSENRIKEADFVAKKNEELALMLNQKRIELGHKTEQNQVALKNVEKQINNLQRERELDQQTILLLEKEKNLNKDELAQQRLLLYVMAGILVIFMGVSIVVYRNIQAKKRAHNLLYLKSLRAQMNPHFIFNSLNSVNNYIAKSDARAANKYLSKFSKLMRQVLEHSQVEFISLAQEIEVLKIYLELEHERFKDHFEYAFKVDPKIPLDSIQIPPMLIQPFIENAIWHGLRYRDEGGLLEVHFKREVGFIQILIRDNGIGRQKSQELKTENQKKHQSTGMQNVESRTTVLNAVFRAKIIHEILDLPDGGGTEVTIKIEWDEDN